MHQRNVDWSGLKVVKTLYRSWEISAYGSLLLSSSSVFCFFLTFQWRHSARESNQSEI